MVHFVKLQLLIDCDELGSIHEWCVGGKCMGSNGRVGLLVGVRSVEGRGWGREEGIGVRV